MTQDELIEMAKQIATQASKVGPYRTWTHEYAMSLIMQLVDASAAKEREACAKICQEFNFGQAPTLIQNRIRARGEK